MTIWATHGNLQCGLGEGGLVPLRPSPAHSRPRPALLLVAAGAKKGHSGSHPGWPITPVKAQHWKGRQGFGQRQPAPGTWTPSGEQRSMSLLSDRYGFQVLLGYLLFGPSQANTLLLRCLPQLLHLSTGDDHRGIMVI